MNQDVISHELLEQLHRVQTLALHVGLQGRYRVNVAYYGVDNLVEVNVYRRNPRNDIWVVRRTMAAAMPTRDSDPRQGELALHDLRTIAEHLELLLAEGQPS